MGRISLRKGAPTAERAGFAGENLNGRGPRIDQVDVSAIGTARSRGALPTTEKELKLNAAAAMIGQPKERIKYVG